MKKKVLALTLSLMMAFSLVACGGDEQGAASVQESSDVQDSKVQESSEASVSDGAYATLSDWMKSDEAAQTVEATNKIIESTGMTIKLSADGDVFVYEYYVSDDLGLKSLSEDQISENLQPVVDAQNESLQSLFDTFENAYGLKLSAIRLTFFTEDGEQLFSCDVTNE